MRVKIKKIDGCESIVNKLKKGKYPRICIVGCLHGNEKIGEKIVEQINRLEIKNGTLIAIIGNPEAVKLNKRCIDQDLNRSFPGRVKGNYEENIAYKIKKIISECDIVFDIHSTTTDVKSLVIVAKMDRKTKEILQVVNPEKIVLMKKSISKQAMISYCKIGISMEYGKDKNMEAYREIRSGILSVLVSLGMIDFSIKRKLKKADTYKIIDVIKNDDNFIASKKIKNFELIKKGDVIAMKRDKALKADEDFYPVLFGEKEYKNIFGFKAKKLKI